MCSRVSGQTHLGNLCFESSEPLRAVANRRRKYGGRIYPIAELWTRRAAPEEVRPERPPYLRRRFIKARDGSDVSNPQVLEVGLTAQP